MKTCSKCKTEQPLTHYSKHPLGKNGLRAHCKDCGKRESLEFRKKNPAYTRAWHEKNRDKKEAAHRNYGYRKFKKNECESCGFVALDWCQLDVDHIDGDHFNNTPSNLQTLCANCHRLKSKIAGDTGRPKLQLVEKEIKLCRQ